MTAKPAEKKNSYEIKNKNRLFGKMVINFVWERLFTHSFIRKNKITDVIANFTMLLTLAALKEFAITAFSRIEEETNVRITVANLLYFLFIQTPWLLTSRLTGRSLTSGRSLRGWNRRNILTRSRRTNMILEPLI